VTVAAAYLGGDLVYRRRIGVDHAPSVDDGWRPPREWKDVAAESKIAEGRSHQVEVAGQPVLLVRHAGRVRALAATCSHLGGPLADGKLEHGTVVCPWHGSRFSLEDGRVIDGPATFPQPCLEARIRDGRIEVRLPAEPCGATSAPRRGSRDRSRARRVRSRPSARE
jgi:nitrite reductase/ring-hydroxylating ferredoxin subunit